MQASRPGLAYSEVEQESARSPASFRASAAQHTARRARFFDGKAAERSRKEVIRCMTDAIRVHWTANFVRLPMDGVDFLYAM